MRTTLPRNGTVLGERSCSYSGLGAIAEGRPRLRLGDLSCLIRFHYCGNYQAPVQRSHHSRMYSTHCARCITHPSPNARPIYTDTRTKEQRNVEISTHGYTGKYSERIVRVCICVSMRSLGLSFEFAHRLLRTFWVSDYRSRSGLHAGLKERRWLCLLVAKEEHLEALVRDPIARSKVQSVCVRCR